MGERTPAEASRQLIGVTTFFLVLTTITTVVRFYVKLFIGKNLGIDDLFAALAWLTGIATCVFVYEGFHYSGSEHMAHVLPLNIPKAMMYWKFTELGYTATTTFLKLSVSFLLLRIIIKRWQAIVVWFIVVLVSTYGIGYFMFVVFECQPAEYFWTRFYGAKGYCIPTSLFGKVTYGHSAISVLADWTLALLPIAVVWNLQMNPRTKITVTMILGMGAIASCAVVIRIPYVKVLVESHDFLFDSPNVVLWTMIEPGLGTTAMNLATLRPLFQTFFSRVTLFHRSGGTSNKNTKDSSGSSSSGKFCPNCQNSISNSNNFKPIRNKYQGGMDDFELGLTTLSDSDGKSGGRGVTTVVHTDLGSFYDESTAKVIERSESQEQLTDRGSSVAYGITRTVHFRSESSHVGMGGEGNGRMF